MVEVATFSENAVFEAEPVTPVRVPIAVFNSASVETWPTPVPNVICWLEPPLTAMVRVVPDEPIVSSRLVVALMAAEIDGSNGVIPFVWAARLGLPVVDADGMGRAFPEIPQVTMEIAGISPNPAVMTDERGNVIVFRATDGDWMERMERAAAVEFGGMSWSSEYQLTVEQARAGAVVNHAVSLAVRLGTVVAEAEQDPVEALAREIHAARLIVGKIVDVERRVMHQHCPTCWAKWEITEAQIEAQHAG